MKTIAYRLDWTGKIRNEAYCDTKKQSNIVIKQWKRSDIYGGFTYEVRPLKDRIE